MNNPFQRTSPSRSSRSGSGTSPGPDDPPVYTSINEPWYALCLILQCSGHYRYFHGHRVASSTSDSTVPNPPTSLPGEVIRYEYKGRRVYSVRRESYQVRLLGHYNKPTCQPSSSNVLLQRILSTISKKHSGSLITRDLISLLTIAME